MPIHSDFFFYASALVLGVVAGMRSMMAPAVLAITLSRRPELVPAAAPAHWLALRPIAIILGVLALAELVVDKLPSTPSRTALGPFLLRLITGAVSGAALVQLGGISGWIGAGCGVVGAILGTFGAFYARRYVGRITGGRDTMVGVLEDVLAIAIAATVAAMLVR
jgi:uncharacterized membrane protein